MYEVEVLLSLSGMIRKISGMCSFITNDLKNTLNHDLIICHCLIHQENLSVKSIKVSCC